MANTFSLNPLVVIGFALLLSIAFNLSAIYVFHHHLGAYERVRSVDDSHFSYVGDDYPNQLPLHLPSIAQRVEDSDRYGLSDYYAWSDWRSTDTFPHGNGFVNLGPDGRKFGNEICQANEICLTTIVGVAMFHQMHCLQMIRNAIVQGDPGEHTRHCLNLIRQTILCTSDITIDPLTSATGIDGLGIIHVCRDWQRVYDFVEDNQLKYMNKTANGR